MVATVVIVDIHATATCGWRSPDEQGVTVLRKGLAVLAVAVLGLTGCSSQSNSTAGSTPSASPSDPAASIALPVDADLGRTFNSLHAATAVYANDVGAAEKAGYMIITPMMPGMGYHYMNPNIPNFNAITPQILVYVKTQNTMQLVALEWVFTEKPKQPPFPGATYGTFDAACHYKDGIFIPAPDQKSCAPTSATGSPFSFWHPNLVTLHVWLWYYNPAGLYHSTNPLVDPYRA
jgi:hypothetical protein